MSGFLDRIPDGYYTRSQLAKALSCHLSTIKRMEHDGDIRPTRKFQVGTLLVSLYSDADLAKAKAALEARTPGRPPTATQG